MRFFRVAMISLAVLSLLVFRPTFSVASEVKLKAASFLQARSVYAKYFFRWVDEVNSHCEDKVKISITGIGELHNTVEASDV